MIYTYIYSSCVRAGVCGILFGVLFIKYGAIAVGRTQFCLSPPPSRSEDVQTLHSSRQFFHKQWLGLTLLFPQLGPGPCVVTISGLYTFMSLVKPFGICAREVQYAKLRLRAILVYNNFCSGIHGSRAFFCGIFDEGMLLVRPPV